MKPLIRTRHSSQLLRTVAGSALLVLALSACQSTPDKDGADQPRLDLGAVRVAAEQAYAAGDWEAARPHYEALVRALPQDGAFWFRLGNVYARTERPDAAVAAYREAAVRNAADGKIWFNMGVVQLRQAANTFLKMDLHVDHDDPLSQQGARAYAMIMRVLGEPREDAAASPGPTGAAAVDAQALDDNDSAARLAPSGAGDAAAVTGTATDMHDAAKQVE